MAFPVLLGHWLSDTKDLEVVGTVTSGTEAVEQIGEMRPDVVLLDHLMYDVPGGSAELAPRLREQCPGVGIVLMSGMPGPDVATIAARCSADAHVSKASRPEQICAAVRDAAACARAHAHRELLS